MNLLQYQHYQNQFLKLQNVTFCALFKLEK